MFGSYYPSNPFDDKPSKRKDDWSFDLIETQELIRDTFNPKKLYEMLENFNILYKDNKIGKYELEELKESVFFQFERIREVKESLD